MRHHKRRVRLGVKSPHRMAMIRNLTLGLIENGRIRTTVARAKLLRPFVEKLVTRLKDPTVANIRVAKSALPHRDAVIQIYQDIAPKFKDRPGGYLRILKLSNPRPGDNADLALIEWVDRSLVRAYSDMEKKSETPKKGSKATSKNSSKKKVAKSDSEAGGTAKKAKAASTSSKTEKAE
jgi:large subunit ribosomal protein L17